jgi:SulP family sulfate permease
MTDVLPMVGRAFTQPIHTLRQYTPRKLGRDLVAGLTVAVVDLPQAMAYALVAGVPPEYGVYTSIFQGILAALFSSSDHLTTGPTNTQSLLVASAVTRLAGSNPNLYLSLVFALTILKGIIQLGFAAVGMGDLVRYVGRSVILGVASGAGVLILIGQLPHLLGLKVPRVSQLPGIIGQLSDLIPVLGQTNMLAIGLGCLGIAIIVALRLISRMLPGALAAVVVLAIVVWMMGPRATLPTLSSLPTHVPAFVNPIPDWQTTEALLGGALALALIGMLETVSISKTLAARTGNRVSPSQEFFAQGFVNVVTGFLQCIPGSGSFTRSALNYDAGAQTRFAAVYNALFVAVFYFLLADFARYVPLAALGAVLVVISFSLIEWRYPLRVWRASRDDAVVFLVTVVATLLAPLQYAIFIGIFLNLALHLRAASRLHLSEMIFRGDRFIERPLSDRGGEEAVMFVQFEGDLFFAVADELQDRLSILPRSATRVVIIRLKRTHSIDSTVFAVLEQFVAEMQRRGKHVLLCGVRPELMHALRSYGLLKQLGPENVFEAGPGVFTAAKPATRPGTGRPVHRRLEHRRR